MWPVPGLCLGEELGNWDSLRVLLLQPGYQHVGEFLCNDKGTSCGS